MGGSSLRQRRLRVAFIVGVLAGLLIPAIALGHIERASYWPDPAPDKAGTKTTGGAVPDARSLKSAVRAKKRSEEHTSELQSQSNLVCRLLLEKKKKNRSRCPHQHHPRHYSSHALPCS